MKISPIPSNESERLLALRELNILDTAAEKDFDDITLLASQICDTPISYISLLDKDRQWFKSSKGLSITETNRDISFCSHTIHQSDIMIVPDVLMDDRFVDNPKVIGYPFIRLKWVLCALLTIFQETLLLSRYLRWRFWQGRWNQIYHFVQKYLLKNLLKKSTGALLPI